MGPCRRKVRTTVGCAMLDAGSWMLDVGCWMLDPRCSNVGTLPTQQELNEGTNWCQSALSDAL